MCVLDKVLMFMDERGQSERTSQCGNLEAGHGQLVLHVAVLVQQQCLQGARLTGFCSIGGAGSFSVLTAIISLHGVVAHSLQHPDLLPQLLNLSSNIPGYQTADLLVCILTSLQLPRQRV